MGKKGDLLRAMKKKRATYTFTAAQLEEHDRQVRMAAIERKKEDLKKYAKQVISDDFAEREKIFSGDAVDVTMTVFSMLIAISCRVLVERFGWKPAPMRKEEGQGGDRRYKLTQFAYYVMDEVDKLTADEFLDIRKYAEESYQLTGVKFEAEDIEEEENGAS